MSVTNKRSYDREQRVSNARKKTLYSVHNGLNNTSLLEIAVAFLNLIIMVIRRRKVADNSNKLVFLKKHDRQCSINVTLRRVRVTMVAVEKQ